jgi:hypothetical protein
MGWDKGRYYTRSKKVNGRVVREYVGTGYVAELAAQLDAVERERKNLERAETHMGKLASEALDESLQELNDLAELLARAALVAAGFHRHKRGEWRKKREQRDHPTAKHQERDGPAAGETADGERDQISAGACPEGG